MPVEQQWVSRIYKAALTAQERVDIGHAFAEKVSTTDELRVFREYAEAGNKFIIGEVFGVEAKASEVAAEYPDAAFPKGASFKEDPMLPKFATFDKHIQDAPYHNVITLFPNPALVTSTYSLAFPYAIW